MISVEYFQLTEDFQERELLVTLIDLIQETVKEFANPLNKSIKVIGLEEDKSIPRLILLDLVATRPYIREFNILEIRINTSNYEVIANEDIYVVDDSNSIVDIINIIISDFDIQGFADKNKLSDRLKPADANNRSKGRGVPIYVEPDPTIEVIPLKTAKRTTYVDTTKGIIPARVVARATTYVGKNIEVTPNRVTSKSVVKGHNKRVLLKRINNILAEKKLGFLATNLDFQVGHVLASDNHGNSAKFLLVNRRRSVSVKGPVEISLKSPIINADQKINRRL